MFLLRLQRHKRALCLSFLTASLIAYIYLQNGVEPVSNYSQIIGELVLKDRNAVLLSPNADQRFAYVTLVGGQGYLPGALALYASYLLSSEITNSKQTTVDFIAAVPKELPSDVIQQLFLVGFKIIKIDQISPPPKFTEKARKADLRLAQAYSKLFLWKLTQYTRIIFLDSDCFMAKNSSELFSNFSHVELAAVRGEPLFNSGVMVFRPSDRIYQFMMQVGEILYGWHRFLMRSISKHACVLPAHQKVLSNPDSNFSYLKADQGFLGSIFNNGSDNILFSTSFPGEKLAKPGRKRNSVQIYEQLSGKYNARVTDYEKSTDSFHEYAPFWPFGEDSFPLSEAAIIHFNGVPKPWDPKVSIKQLMDEYGVLYTRWKLAYEYALDLIRRERLSKSSTEPDS